MLDDPIPRPYLGLETDVTAFFFFNLFSSNLEFPLGPMTHAIHMRVPQWESFSEDIWVWFCLLCELFFPSAKHGAYTVLSHSHSRHKSHLTGGQTKHQNKVTDRPEMSLHL